MSIDLKAHIAKLRAEGSSNSNRRQPAISDNNILFWGTLADKDYLPLLKGCVGSSTVFLRLEKVDTIAQVTMYCAAKGITKVISSSPSLLIKALKWEKRAAPSLDSYAGSYFKLPPFKPGGTEIELVFIKPLKQLATVPHGKFMVTRLVSKLTKPDTWYKPTEFTGYILLDATNEKAVFSSFSSAFLICIDIETFKENAAIRCLSYTAFFQSNNTRDFYSSSVVLPMDSVYNLSIMRKWNWNLQAPKVFQNGKYDISYLARYSAPVYNYLYDTAVLFHSWYSELPKDLGFLNSFFIREAVYWKDLAETNDLHEYYRYNALDTWGTGNAFLAMIAEAPKFAFDNYLLEFPLTFPCHLSEMTGIARDMDKFAVARAEQEAIIEKYTASLNTILGIPAGASFNVKSSPQKKALFKLLGCSDLKSQDEKNINKARYRHPFNARVLGLVLKIIKARTLISNYLTEGKEFYSLSDTTKKNPRFLYSLNPHGTDSSRLASKSHHFWTGDNIQKIPRGTIIKQTFKADPGFFLAEVDLEQAESRDTAYISGDETLIHNVEYSPDFHCTNASAFFGIPFEELYDTAAGKSLNKTIRDLAKRVNHGANYNMGAYVLIDTMGEENIQTAKSLLRLPRMWSYKQVAEYLLESFHKTYQDIKGVFYKGVIEEIARTHKLSSKAYHMGWHSAKLMDKLQAEWAANYELLSNTATGIGSWTRYCFADPSKSKPALNSYISHPPQSLNAQTLNKAYLNVFNDIAINPEHSNNFKLLAQIHDSILFQYREGHDYLCDMVKERMEIPVIIKGYDNKIRTFVVPAGIKKGDHLPTPHTGKATHWSMTE